MGYKAVVIGSGIAGIAASIRLAAKDIKWGCLRSIRTPVGSDSTSNQAPCVATEAKEIW